MINYIIIGVEIVFLIFIIISLAALITYYKNREVTELRKKLEIQKTLQEKSKMNIIKNNTIMNFDKDIQALMFMTDHLVKVFKKNNIETAQASNERMKINDSNLSDITADLVAEIIGTFSPTYKEVLSKYFTEDALYKFIAELVYTNLINTCVAVNANSINNNKNTIFTYEDIEQPKE